MASVYESLPPTGREMAYFGHAADVPLQVNGLGLVNLDFRGAMRQRVEAKTTEGLGSARMKNIGVMYSADSPVLGRVTLEQDGEDEPPLGLLEITGERPPTYRHTTYHDFTLTIERPPGGGAPLVLTNTKPAVIGVDKLTAFPPQGAVYQLQAPVDFAPAGEPGRAVAQLMQFPLTVTSES